LQQADIKARGSTARLLLVGDSITQAWSEAQSGQTAFDTFLVPRWKPLNLGVAGDQTQHTLWRLMGDRLLSEDGNELFPPNSPSGNPAGAGQLQGVGEQCKLVLLMLGTNNAGHRQRASDTVKGLRAVVELIRSRMPLAHIIVSTIFPRADAQQPFVINQQVNAALMGTAPPEPVFSPVQVAAMPGMAQGWPGAAISPLRPSSSPNPAAHQLSPLHDPAHGVFVYDLSAAFLQPGSAALSLSSDTSSLPNVDPEYFMPDLVHLAPKGYWRWAQVLMPILERHESLMAETKA